MPAVSIVSANIGIDNLGHIADLKEIAWFNGLELIDFFDINKLVLG